MADKKKLTRRGFLSAIAGAAGAGAIWQLKAQKGVEAAHPGPVPPGADRLPPGQHWVQELVEYSAGGRPGIDAAAWRLTVEGLVTKPLSFTLAEFGALTHVELVKDFHCVTTWSVKDCRWSGVRLADLLKRADPIPAASHVFAECLGGYSANFPLAVALDSDVLLADGLGGKPIEPRFGGPVRLVVPRLYAYKSAKWVARIMLMAGDRQGYWERNGYSNRADPWREQRTSADD
jgi:DMSO/TMAO reductase YedYZ molybdopterin-dependent catalytic subunit